jgi:hypothetical protein
MRVMQAIARIRQAFNEQRRSVREAVQFPAWVDFGNGTQRRNCTVLDVSDHGARIMVESSASVPREFWLVLTKSGTRRRRCRVVWRSDGQIGVSYLGPLECRGLQH